MSDRDGTPSVANIHDMTHLFTLAEINQLRRIASATE